MAHVIVPTFIKDFNEDLDKDVYGNVIRILKALKSTDDGVIEYFKMRGHGKKCGRQIAAGEYFDKEVYAKEINLDKWYDVIDEKVWQMVDGFEYMYDKVRVWIDENGKIPEQIINDKYQQYLGSWCSRKRRKKNKLNTEEYEKLELLDGWSWSVQDDRFNKTYNELLKWIRINKRLPSHHSKEELEARLGRWYNTRKQDYDKMSSIRIKKLKNIPGWKLPIKLTKKNLSFDERYKIKNMG